MLVAIIVAVLAAVVVIVAVAAALALRARKETPSVGRGAFHRGRGKLALRAPFQGPGRS